MRDHWENQDIAYRLGVAVELLRWLTEETAYSVQEDVLERARRFVQYERRTVEGASDAA